MYSTAQLRSRRTAQRTSPPTRAAQVPAHTLSAAGARAHRLAGAVAITVASLALIAAPVLAGTTGAVGLHTPNGAGAIPGFGDYVSATAALNTFFSYYIEVPPGLASLQAQVFDADVGAGGAAEAGAGRDRDRGGFDTSATYTLFNPTGAVAGAALALGPAACPACDNAWTTIGGTVANPIPGHWELRVDMTPGAPGDDINAIGVRAHDGTAGAGGTELNVYYHSFADYGTQTGVDPRVYTDHPYVSSGCSGSRNDFDWDGPGTGPIALNSRTGVLINNSPVVSGNDAWNRVTFTGWTSDAVSGDYGIWTQTVTIALPGGATGNYGNLYTGSFLAAAVPPTAQPEANTFRVYLPTDGGAAPVEPYVEQLVTFLAGNNPPIVGSPSTFVITVRVVNPSANSITFSSPTNVVTANVPGGQVLYAGTVQISQGSIVSQPAVGGSGNVVWNPGTVAAGATVLLSYRLTVTPTGAGRIPVSGTPTLSGTSATYVDPTCSGAACAGAQLATATYTFGPLCEVAVDTGLSTHSLVTSFDAYDLGGEVVVEWQTRSEAGTLGWELERLEHASGTWRQVHDSMVMSMVESPQGGTYRLHDDGAATTAPVTYRLVEIESTGHREVFGPVTVQPTAEPIRESTAEPQGFDIPSGSYTRTPRRLEAREVAKLDTETFAPRRFWWRGSTLKIGVEENGVYHLSAAEIAAASGLGESAVRQFIALRNYSLTHRGRAVAWLADGTDGLFFYGQARDSIYGDESVYWLRRGRGQTMAHAPVGAVAPVEPTLEFTTTEHHEVDTFAALVLPLDAESDYWFWRALTAGHPTAASGTFSVPVESPATGSDASLAVHLQGASNSGIAGEHLVEVRLNGAVLGNASWSGIAAHSATFAVDPSLLIDGTNDVELVAFLGNSATSSFVYLDSLDLTFNRTYVTGGSSLRLEGNGHPLVTVEGLPSADVLLLALDDPASPTVTDYLADQSAGVNRITFAPAGAGTPYLAVEASAIKSPSRVWADSPSRLRWSFNRADYLVIAPPELVLAAQSLANYRRGRGLSSMVVSLEDIADEFDDGMPSPHAVRRFLEYTRSFWRRTPRFVVLAANGTYDYRNLLGMNDNLLPPLMVTTSHGIFASDVRLVGHDSGMAIGRIPANNAQALLDYVDKIEAYESTAAPSWGGRLLWLADHPAPTADFPDDSDFLASLAPAGYSSEAIYLSDLGLAQARALLFGHLDSGVALVNYYGHGGPDRLADSGVLTDADVALLNNGERLPVISALTCTVNRFEIPGLATLGEKLVLKAGGGVAAIWAPSGLSLHAAAKVLGDQWVRALLQDGESIVGTAVLRASAEFELRSLTPEMLDVYVLLGDPALELRPAPDAADLPPAFNPSDE